MMYHFKRNDIALFGLADYHEYLATKQFKIAKKLMDYQVSRGGRVVRDTLQAPVNETEWNTPTGSLECCLAKFKSHNESFGKTFALAQEKKDPHLSNFIQHELVQYANELITQLAENVSFILSWIF